jgi:crotonobetainyl-CoA:carnitine CoA-transferase CaiB-like acyl-CoA transferase
MVQQSTPIGQPTHAGSGAELPLSGVLVAELCQIAAGPYCGMLLADMGADVIKIEPPGGDAMRQWPPLTRGLSENFASLNRNKRSIALNLKEPADLAIALAIAAKVDVLLENNRPGVMQSLGLGYERLRADRPGLVYCSISAFGQRGPRAREGAFDVTMQAVSGIMSVTGAADGAPVKCGVPVSDFATGLYAAFNIVAALLRRGRSGEGTHIDASMLGASLGIAALQTSEFFGTGRNPRKLGSSHPRNAPYQAFRAADDYFVIAAGNDALWHKVCDVVGRPEWKDDARFLTTAERAANQTVLAALLEAIFAGAPAAAWREQFTRAGVPCAPISQYGEVLGDPQVEAYDWIKTVALDHAQVIRTFGVPIGMSGLDFPIRRPPPSLDADRADVLAWALR